jgi:hypothetical protein
MKAGNAKGKYDMGVDGRTVTTCRQIEQTMSVVSGCRWLKRKSAGPCVVNYVLNIINA